MTAVPACPSCGRTDRVEHQGAGGKRYDHGQHLANEVLAGWWCNRCIGCLSYFRDLRYPNGDLVHPPDGSGPCPDCGGARKRLSDSWYCPACGRGRTAPPEGGAGVETAEAPALDRRQPLSPAMRRALERLDAVPHPAWLKIDGGVGKALVGRGLAECDGPGRYRITTEGLAALGKPTHTGDSTP